MERGMRFAITADRHAGGPEDRFGTDIFWENIIGDFDPEKIDGILFLGDNSHSGNLQVLDRSLRTVKRKTKIPIYVLSGNHDWQIAFPDVVKDVTEQTGASVLDNNLIILRREGISVGIIGLNGAVLPEVMKAAKQQWPNDRWARVPLLYQETEAMYATALQENIARLQKSSPDISILVTHVPIHRALYPRHVELPVLPETSPQLGKIADAVTFDAEFSGHVHSQRRESDWRVVPQITSNHGGILRANVAAETAIQEGFNPFLIIELIPGEPVKIIPPNHVMKES